MKYLNNETIEKLNIQQQKIIDSTEEKIVVTACPGAGKTFTIVKRIQKELKGNQEYTGIIACSFTNEASLELKRRIEKKVDISNCFINTIDSFILSEIIQVYINRYLKLKYKNYRKVKIEKVVFPNKKNNKYINLLTRYPNMVVERNKYYNKWLNQLVKGVYEVSFPSYIFATKIMESELISHIFIQRFSSIYIDEAQDLNYDQHKFIDALREKTGIKVVMVGDPNQSIYQFRGAQPDIFRNLESRGYNKYSISVNVRCHPSIAFYSEKLLDEKVKIESLQEKRVSFIEKLNLQFIDKLSDGLFIICEKKDTAERFYDKLKNRMDIYYVQPLDINADDYNSNRGILEEIIKYFFNHNNSNPKNIYLDDDFLNVVKISNPKIKKSNILVGNNDVQGYIKYISDLIGIEISNETLNEISYQLRDDIHKYYYYLTNRNNRVMTIHSSKGLENKNVFVILENEYDYDIEYKNKLYVAFTRAIDNLYLYSMPTFKYEEKIRNILKDS